MSEKQLFPQFSFWFSYKTEIKSAIVIFKWLKTATSSGCSTWLAFGGKHNIDIFSTNKELLTNKEFKRRHKRWITSANLNCIGRKNKLYKKYNKCKNTVTRNQIFQEYKTLKNK